MARKHRRKSRPEKTPDGTRSQERVLNLGVSVNVSLLSTGLIFLVHGLGLAFLFAPSAGLFNTAPIIDQDWGLHFHHLKSLAAFWRQDHMVWGYNPFFMAGYPSNTIQDLSIKFFEFVALGLSAFALTPVQWFKISAFLAMASVPWLIYCAARNFFCAHELKDLSAVIAAFLATVYWWNSLPREMFFYGMIGFPAASYLSVLGVSLFYRLAAQPERVGWPHLGWLLFAAAILPLHVQSVLTFLPPMVVLLLLSSGFPGGRLIGWIAGAAALSLVVNVIWLMPALDHLTDDVSSAIVEQLPLFVSANPFTFFLDYLGPRGFWTFRPSFSEKGFRLTLLLLGVLGIRGLIRSRDRTVGIILASALTGLFIVTYFGGLAPFMKPWQPLRFKVPLDIFLVIGAAYSVSQWLGSRRTESAAVVPVLVCCGLIAFFINVVQTESTGKLRLRSNLNPHLHAIVEWIERETPAGARVLFEESGDETGFVYDGVYLSSLLPHLTGRQLIGGPINLYNDRHHFAEFHSGKIFKRSVQTLSDEELRNYLRLYNIGAVVAFHPASIRQLQSIAGLVTVEQRIGPVHLMKVNQPSSWFIKGDGAVRAGFNRLELADLKGNEIVLKYHWIEGLSAAPATSIEPIKMADDPIPFIKLLHPPARVTLRVGSSE